MVKSFYAKNYRWNEEQVQVSTCIGSDQNMDKNLKLSGKKLGKFIHNFSKNY